MKSFRCILSLAVLSMWGCFSADNFEPAFQSSQGSCALSLVCEPEMEEVRVCDLTSQCVPPFPSEGTQPAIPQQGAGSNVIDLQTDENPIIRLTSQYLQDLISGSNVAQFQGYSLVSIYAHQIVIDGTPTSDAAGAERVFSVDPQLAQIVDLHAQEIWIRHGTVFKSAGSGDEVIFRLDPTEALYVDKDVLTNGAGACPCVSINPQSIRSVDGSVTTGHNCVNVPACADLEN